MGDRTKIEWTEATWNPATGCTKVSPGCDNCYAESIAHRFAGTKAYPDGFAPTLRPERLGQPLRWTRPRRIFVCSMADLFHDAVPDDYIAQVFAVMAAAPQHTFQVLTKRHARMRALLNSATFQTLVLEHTRAYGDVHYPWPMPNVWVGVSAENQQWADIRIRALIDTPAAVRWVSAEPLLGPIDLLGDAERPGPAIVREGVLNRTDYGTGVEYDYDDQVGIDWVVTGGESGRLARPMNPSWASYLAKQCAQGGIAFLHKQNGQYVEVLAGQAAERGDLWVHGDGLGTTDWTPDTRGAQAGRWGPHRDALVRRVSKADAGRLLDGRVYDGYPEPALA
jgi:protein gp37